MEKWTFSATIYISILVCLISIATSANNNNIYGAKQQNMMSNSYSNSLPPSRPLAHIRHSGDAMWENLDKLNRVFFMDNSSTLSQLYLTLANLYLPSANDANPQCARDLQAIAKGVLSPTNDTLWALRVVDSWGKYHDGLLEGSFLFPGFFQECLDVSVNNKQLQTDFTGQYCSLSYKVKSNKKEAKGKNSSLSLNAHRLGMPYASAFIAKSMPINFLYGTCMPSTCTKEELVRNINNALSSENMAVSVAECNVSIEISKLRTLHIIGIILFLFLAFVLLLATIISMVSKHIPYLSSGILKYILIFSVPDNIIKIFSLSEIKKISKETISCLHGIRFLSICWVILGHQYVFSKWAAVNPYDFLKIIKPTIFQIIANAYLSVDTFFFLSGLLVCYGFLKKQNQLGHFSIVLYYIHRVIRLLPAILILTAFLATISGLMLSTSPYSWKWHQNIVANCRNHWWWDSTFATNFLHVYKQQDSCLPLCWYVAVDTQLYVLMPLVIFPLIYAPKRGLSLLLFWTTVFCIIPAAIIGAYNLPPMIIMSDPRSGEYSNKVYSMTWTRASPYLIGVLTGYLLFTNAQSQMISIASIRVRFTIYFGWIVAFIVNAAVVFGMWKYNHSEKSNEIPLSVSILYGGLHRAVWAVTLSWIVCCCHWGYGGPINWFLSHPIWQPFSRLTYCFYLTSIPVQFAIFVTMYRPSYYSNINKIQETCGVLFFTFLSSVILSLVSEVPAANLEKIILQKLNMNRNGFGEYREIAVLVEEETTERGREDGNGNTEVEGELGEQEIISV